MTRLARWRWWLVGVMCAILALWGVSLRWAMGYGSPTGRCAVGFGRGCAIVEFDGSSTPPDPMGWVVIINPGLVAVPRVKWAVDGWTAFFPLWIPILMLAVPTALAWRTHTRLVRASKVGLCPKCNYSLTGLPAGSACPECGGGKAAAG